MSEFNNLFSQAEKLKKEGKYSDALNLFRKLYDKAPDDFRVLNQIALVELSLKKYTEALALFTRSIELRPDQSFIVVKIAQIYISNIFGQVVWTAHPIEQSQVISVSLSDIPSGVYFLSWVTEDGLVQQSRLVKQ